MTDADRKQVKAFRLRSVTAKDGEVLADFSKRVDNALPLPMLMLINALSPNAVLKDGQVLRIAKQEVY
jgi:predicted Zn-dependent protease